MTRPTRSRGFNRGMRRPFRGPRGGGFVDHQRGIFPRRVASGRAHPFEGHTPLQTNPHYDDYRADGHEYMAPNEEDVNRRARSRSPIGRTNPLPMPIDKGPPMEREGSLRITVGNDYYNSEVAVRNRLGPPVGRENLDRFHDDRPLSSTHSPVNVTTPILDKEELERQRLREHLMREQLLRQFGPKLYDNDVDRSLLKPEDQPQKKPERFDYSHKSVSETVAKKSNEPDRSQHHNDHLSQKHNQGKDIEHDRRRTSPHRRDDYGDSKDRRDADRGRDRGYDRERERRKERERRSRDRDADRERGRERKHENKSGSRERSVSGHDKEKEESRKEKEKSSNKLAESTITNQKDILASFLGTLGMSASQLGVNTGVPTEGLKPKKSILKKKFDDELSDDGSVSTSASLTLLQSAYDDKLPAAASRATRKPLIDSSPYPGLDNEDEDQFLYGNEKPSVFPISIPGNSKYPSLKDDSSDVPSWMKTKSDKNILTGNDSTVTKPDSFTDSLSSRLEKYVTNLNKRQPNQMESIESSEGEKLSIIPSKNISNTTAIWESYFKQKSQNAANASSSQEQNNPPVEQPDPTIANILKSIGFDFEMSKRMQARAKGSDEKPKDKEEEKAFGINTSTSFLGGGLSTDVKTDLFNKEKKSKDSTHSSVSKQSELEDYKSRDAIKRGDKNNLFQREPKPVDFDEDLYASDHSDSHNREGRYEFDEDMSSPPDYIRPKSIDSRTSQGKDYRSQLEMDVERLIKEAQENVKKGQSGYGSRENESLQFLNEELKEERFREKRRHDVQDLYDDHHMEDASRGRSKRLDSFSPPPSKRSSYDGDLYGDTHRHQSPDERQYLGGNDERRRGSLERASRYSDYSSTDEYFSTTRDHRRRSSNDGRQYSSSELQKSSSVSRDDSKYSSRYDNSPHRDDRLHSSRDDRRYSSREDNKRHLSPDERKYSSREDIKYPDESETRYPERDDRNYPDESDRKYSSQDNRRDEDDRRYSSRDDRKYDDDRRYSSRDDRKYDDDRRYSSRDDRKNEDDRRYSSRDDRKNEDDRRYSSRDDRKNEDDRRYSSRDDRKNEDDRRDLSRGDRKSEDDRRYSSRDDRKSAYDDQRSTSKDDRRYSSRDEDKYSSRDSSRRSRYDEDSKRDDDRRAKEKAKDERKVVVSESQSKSKANYKSSSLSIGSMRTVTQMDFESEEDDNKRDQVNDKKSDLHGRLKNIESDAAKPIDLREKLKNRNRSKVFMAPHEKEKLKKDFTERKLRLENLEAELETLRKQQNELMRRKQRQKDGHKDPILVQNGKLQDEISAQIRALRDASVENALALADASSSGDDKPKEEKALSTTDIKNDKSVAQNKEDSTREKMTSSQDKANEEQKEKKVHYEFFDSGSHWCRTCNHISSNIYDVFLHLQSKKHTQKIDPYNRPWLPEEVKNPPKKPLVCKTRVAPMRGVEFMMPSQAFYCCLCKVFSGDEACAEAHLKSETHHTKYEKYIEENQFYERRLNLDKAAGVSRMREDETREKRKANDDNGEAEKKRKIEEEKPKGIHLNLVKTTQKKTSVNERENPLEKFADSSEEETEEKKVQFKKNTKDTRIYRSNLHDIMTGSFDEEIKNESITTSKNASKDLKSKTTKVDNSKDMKQKIAKFDSSKLPSDKKKMHSAREDWLNRSKVSKTANSQKNSGKTGDSSKKADIGKIAIKITGKTAIRPAPPKALLPWDPVSKPSDLPSVLPPQFPEPLKATVTSDKVDPAPLDVFLTTAGGDSSLPVVSDVKSIPVPNKSQRNTSPQPPPPPPPPPDEKKESKFEIAVSNIDLNDPTDSIEDLKLLGIDPEMSKPLVDPKPPPPLQPPPPVNTLSKTTLSVETSSKTTSGGQTSTSSKTTCTLAGVTSTTLDLHGIDLAQPPPPPPPLPPTEKVPVEHHWSRFHWVKKQSGEKKNLKSNKNDASKSKQVTPNSSKVDDSKSSEALSKNSTKDNANEVSQTAKTSSTSVTVHDTNLSNSIVSKTGQDSVSKNDAKNEVSKDSNAQSIETTESKAETSNKTTVSTVSSVDSHLVNSTDIDTSNGQSPETTQGTVTSVIDMQNNVATTSDDVSMTAESNSLGTSNVDAATTSSNDNAGTSNDHSTCSSNENATSTSTDNNAASTCLNTPIITSNNDTIITLNVNATITSSDITNSISVDTSSNTCSDVTASTSSGEAASTSKDNSNFDDNVVCVSNDNAASTSSDIQSVELNDNATSTSQDNVSTMPNESTTTNSSIANTSNHDTAITASVPDLVQNAPSTSNDITNNPASTSTEAVLETLTYHTVAMDCTASTSSDAAQNSASTSIGSAYETPNSIMISQNPATDTLSNLITHATCSSSDAAEPVRSSNLSTSSTLDADGSAMEIDKVTESGAAVNSSTIRQNVSSVDTDQNSLDAVSESVPTCNNNNEISESLQDNKMEADVTTGDSEAVSQSSIELARNQEAVAREAVIITTSSSDSVRSDHRVESTENLKTSTSFSDVSNLENISVGTSASVIMLSNSDVNQAQLGDSCVESSENSIQQSSSLNQDTITSSSLSTISESIPTYTQNITSNVESTENYQQNTSASNLESTGMNNNNNEAKALYMEDKDNIHLPVLLTRNNPIVSQSLDTVVQFDSENTNSRDTEQRNFSFCDSSDLAGVTIHPQTDMLSNEATAIPKTDSSENIAYKDSQIILDTNGSQASSSSTLIRGAISANTDISDEFTVINSQGTSLNTDAVVGSSESDAHIPMDTFVSHNSNDGTVVSSQDSNGSNTVLSSCENMLTHPVSSATYGSSFPLTSVSNIPVETDTNEVNLQSDSETISYSYSNPASPSKLESVEDEDIQVVLLPMTSNEADNGCQIQNISDPVNIREEEISIPMASNEAHVGSEIKNFTGAVDSIEEVSLRLTSKEADVKIKNLTVDGIEKEVLIPRTSNEADEQSEIKNLLVESMEEEVSLLLTSKEDDVEIKNISDAFNSMEEDNINTSTMSNVQVVDECENEADTSHSGIKELIGGEPVSTTNENVESRNPACNISGPEDVSLSAISDNNSEISGTCDMQFEDFEILDETD